MQTYPRSSRVPHGGGNDFLVHVGARDAERLRDLTIDAFTTRPEIGAWKPLWSSSICRPGADLAE